MEIVNAFAIFWILFNGYTLYKVLISSSDEERDDIHNELVDMCRTMTPTAVGKTMVTLFLAVMVLDIIGFYLTYTYAYTMEENFYTRILLFLAFVLVFFIDQIVSFRQTMKIAAALRIPNIRDDVLKRLMRMTERDMDFINTISAVAKFVAALQLVLYTILTKSS